MIKLFETAKLKELEQYTIDHEPIVSIELVERAAVAFVKKYGHHYPRHKYKHVFVLAGQGNNGADALAIARLLAEDNYPVEAYLFNPTMHLSPDCEFNKQRLLNEHKVRLVEVFHNFEPPEMTSKDVVIDGLFGSGLNRPLSGGFAGVVNYVNQSEATVVSIDIPSGLFGEKNSLSDPPCIIHANRTYTFEFPKLSLLFPENEIFTGKWDVAQINLLPDSIERTETPYKQVTDIDVAGIIRPRSKFAHKGIFGHALLIAGSKGKMGAAVLAAHACLRSGIGQLTVHLPQRGETILQTAVPEAMLSLDDHTDFVSSLPDLSAYKAIGIGPGLGTQPSSVTVLESLLKTTTKPLVLDADALNTLAFNNELMSLLPPQTVLTPHPKEFDRLFGESADSYDRLHKAAEKAVEYEIYIILKGAYTATCTPEGNIYINSKTGNPGMATAGSGDVLTGIILGLLAQGYAPDEASIAGVYLHGTAGDLAAAETSQESLMARDLIRMLGKAFKMQKREEE